MRKYKINPLVLVISVPMLILALLFKLLNYNIVFSILLAVNILIVILSKFNGNMLLKMLLILNFIIGSIYSYNIFTNNIINFPDTRGYLAILSSIIQSGSLNLKSVINISGTLHVGPHYLNYLVFAFCSTEYALYLANILMRITSIILFYKHIGLKFSDKVANISSTLLTLSSFLLIFTSDILKDSLILFLAMLSLYFYDVYLKKRKIRYVFYLILILVGLTMTRIYSGIGFAFGIFFDLLVFNTEKKDFKKIIIPSLLILLLTSVTFFNSYISMGVRYVKRINLSINFIVTMIKSVIAFFLSPFFWNMTEEITVYTPLVIDSIFLLILSPLLVVFILRLLMIRDYRHKMYLYLIPIAIHILALGLEYGSTAIRQRIAVYPFIALIYSVEISNLYRKIPNNIKNPHNYQLNNLHNL